jgi:hypothetical protein
MDILPNEVNVVDFGAVQVNDKAMKVITIANSGKFPFDFKWDYQRHPNVILTPGIPPSSVSNMFAYMRSYWNSKSRG